MEKGFTNSISFENLTVEEIMKLPIREDLKNEIVLEILKNSETSRQAIDVCKPVYSWGNQWRDHIPDSI